VAEIGTATSTEATQYNGYVFMTWGSD